MKVYSFSRGGIRFTDPSAPTGDSARVAFLPGISVIPLPKGGVAMAGAGDWVREGMLVARAADKNGAHVHAAVPGRVSHLARWKDAGGEVNEALVIRMGGSFELLGKPEVRHRWEDCAPAELRRLIEEYGIVEMEGEGRPVAAMLRETGETPGGATLVIRCVFDDPWLAADRALCRERPGAVAEGSFIAARAGGFSRIVFAVSKKETQMGMTLLDEVTNGDYADALLPVSIVPVGSRYPQGLRRELELVIWLWEKQEGFSLGRITIFGPATLAAIRDAAALHKPILERYVAVGGSAVRHPQVMRTRLGTRIGELFAECGGFVDQPVKIATGSPFLGRPVMDLDEPVTKTDYAVFALLKGAEKDASAKGACISCGECRAVCPVGFDPEELYKRARLGGANGRAADPAAPVCHGCGCCELVCPSHLPLSALLSGLAGQAGSPGTGEGTEHG